jgi:hypothetical protein
MGKCEANKNEETVFLVDIFYCEKGFIRKGRAVSFSFVQLFLEKFLAK